MSADHEEEGHGRWAKILTFIAGIGFVAGIILAILQSDISEIVFLISLAAGGVPWACVRREK